MILGSHFFITLYFIYVSTSEIHPHDLFPYDINSRNRSDSSAVVDVTFNGLYVRFVLLYYKKKVYFVHIVHRFFDVGTIIQWYGIQCNIHSLPDTMAIATSTILDFTLLIKY